MSYGMVLKFPAPAPPPHRQNIRRRGTTAARKSAHRFHDARGRGGSHSYQSVWATSRVAVTGWEHSRHKPEPQPSPDVAHPSEELEGLHRRARAGEAGKANDSRSRSSSPRRRSKIPEVEKFELVALRGTQVLLSSWQVQTTTSMVWTSPHDFPCWSLTSTATG